MKFLFPYSVIAFIKDMHVVISFNTRMLKNGIHFYVEN